MSGFGYTLPSRASRDDSCFPPISGSPSLWPSWPRIAPGSPPERRCRPSLPSLVKGSGNRRFDTPGEGFWEEIDDGKLHNADLIRVTEGQAPLCWNRKFDLFIDHIVLDRQAVRWIRLYTFEQVIYQEDSTLESKLSDHCPIAVVIETR